MKKFIYIAVVFMLMLIFIGCFATMTPEQRKERYDLRKEVGNEQFVGSSKNNFEASGLMSSAGLW
jgi:hypothetical protein